MNQQPKHSNKITQIDCGTAPGNLVFSFVWFVYGHFSGGPRIIFLKISNRNTRAPLNILGKLFLLYTYNFLPPMVLRNGQFWPLFNCVEFFCVGLSFLCWVELSCYKNITLPSDPISPVLYCIVKIPQIAGICVRRILYFVFALHTQKGLELNLIHSNPLYVICYV